MWRQKHPIRAVADVPVDPEEAVIRLQDYHQTGGSTDAELLVPDRLH